MTTDPLAWREAVLHALLTDRQGRVRPGARVLRHDAVEAVVVLPYSGECIVVRALEDGDTAGIEALRRRLGVLRSAARGSHLSVVVLGGSPSLRGLLGDASSFLGPLTLFHVAGDAPLWCGRFLGRGAQLVRPVLVQALKRAAEEPASLEALAPEERAVLAQGAEPPARDDAAFWAALREATPRGTYALAAVIAVVFAFQSLWGGSEFPLTLLRMGALVRGPILAGELWRLFSATFLHIGLVHVAMNLWALRVLGPFVEKVLGTPRFLVLYGLSAFAGSLASVVLGRAGLAAGASGALWGLMAAEAAMTLRPGVLPESVRVQARSKAGQALLLNVMISFLPRIDMFAHFGGGLMGGLLVATGLFTRGLPRPGTEPAAAPPSFRLPAAVMALLMAASLAAATLAGRPWELRTPPAPALPHRLEGTPLSVAVPPRMPVKVLGVVGEGRAFLIGDDRQHPVVLWVWVGPGEELGRLRERVEGETAPEGATREGAVRVVDVAGVPTLVARSRFGDGALRQTWVTVRGAYSVRIQADSYEGASAAWLLVGESVVASLRQ